MQQIHCVSAQLAKRRLIYSSAKQAGAQLETNDFCLEAKSSAAGLT
jgi:hypothetical protein